MAGPGRNGTAPPRPADVAKVIPLVKRALKVLADREVSPQLGLLKSTLLQLDSTFSERDYGVSTFRDFIEKIAKTGIITLRHSGRSMLVDAAEGMAEVSDSGLGTQPGAVTAASVRATVPEYAPSTDESSTDIGQPTLSVPVRSQQDPTPPPASTPMVRDAEQVQQIVAQTKEVFSRAAQPPRWPMYVRQLKQYIRSVDVNFDERKWGFATVMEFLRVCQREGLFRLERDRRGQVRVFPGAALPRESAPMSQVAANAVAGGSGIRVLDGELQQEALMRGPRGEPGTDRCRRAIRGSTGGAGGCRRGARARETTSGPQEPDSRQAGRPQTDRREEPVRLAGRRPLPA